MEEERRKKELNVPLINSNGRGTENSSVKCSSHIHVMVEGGEQLG